MKKIILTGLCGLGLLAVCTISTNFNTGVTTFGNGGYIDIM